MRILCVVLLLPLIVAPARAEETVRLPVTRDTWVSDVGSESEGNNGGAPRLKIKSFQELSLLDFDPARLRGRVVQSATLHLRSTGEPRLRRVTVSSLGAEWVEGTATGYKPQEGSSSFHHRRNPDVPWAEPGSDLCSVMLGMGGTLWRMADASSPDREGWQHIAVGPDVIAARVGGLSYGFVVFDDTGSEWTRSGEKFTLHHMPNRFFYSKDQNASSAPHFTVVLGPEDRSPPGAPGGLVAEPGDLPAGEAWVSWTTPVDNGPAGTLGFIVTADGKPVPRYLIPLAGEPGGRTRMHLRDLDLKPGASVALSVQAVDRAGNMGPAAEKTVRVSDHSVPSVPKTELKPFATKGPLPKLGAAEVAVIDELDKVNPASGAFIPARNAEYVVANHLWDASTRRVRLQAARNEFVAFQVLIQGDGKSVEPTLRFTDGDPFAIEFGRYQTVATRVGPLPDPIVPLAANEGMPSGSRHSLHCEIYVPHDARGGSHQGRLTLRQGHATLELDVSLEVWDFTLPDRLSFLPEMNCYGLPSNERDYYRLAHRHRTFLNRVPYHQNGAMSDGCAPRWDGKRLDFSEWDKRFGPLFDGSAFADLPRSRVPIEGFYLPLHENWPTPIEGNYNGNYWADHAFPESYRAAFVEASRQFAEHLQRKRWDGTLFQCFFNGKNNFKENGWSRGSSPWLLDEPANFQDFWALRYFGLAFHEGIKPVTGPAQLLFRCDISRPEWQRDAFDGLLDYNVVGGAFRRYRRLVQDRKEAQGQLVIEYGSSNALEDSNIQPAAWAIDAWCLGADGVLPWQTIGTTESWNRADPLALFYPKRNGGPPVPSIRLKSYLRGQQDVEYLTLLGIVTKEPRWAVGQGVRAALKLSAERRGTGSGGEDAGVMHYGRIRPEDLWALRVASGEQLSKAHPDPKRQLVELRTPRRDLSHLAPGEVDSPGGR